MDVFAPSVAEIRKVSKVQFGVLSPEEIVRPSILFEVSDSIFFELAAINRSVLIFQMLLIECSFRLFLRFNEPFLLHETTDLQILIDPRLLSFFRMNYRKQCQLYTSKVL